MTNIAIRKSLNLFFILLLLLTAGILRDAYLNKNRTPEFLRSNLMIAAEIPKNIYHVISYLKGDGMNAVSKLQPIESVILTSYVPAERFDIKSPWSPFDHSAW